MERGCILFVNGGEGCQLYIDALSQGHFTVIHARRPEDALTWLTTDCPDIVVTDLAFADTAVTGTAFIREVRARMDDAVSILVLSQYLRVADRNSAREAGADLFLMKPVLPTALVFEVQRALILRRSGRRLPWNWPRRAAPVVPFPLVDRRRASSHS
jgi:DNA-binding response OmpR family regulator